MSRRLSLSLFSLASVCLCLLAFPGALSGKSLLAPLDVFPNLFSHFRYMDPGATGIPANHHIIDQATYDLPLQYRIYQSLRQGLVPWWDPHTYGGRPLLADAHVNGTDPIRLLCYLLLPFPLAYNFNLILKTFLSGFGVYLLLRHLGHAPLLSGLLALSYQFAGCFAVFFGHPWIQAACLYYPFLWISLDALIKRPSPPSWLATPLLCAFIFYSGNLQSHAYLVLFLMAYTASFFISGLTEVRRAMSWCSICLIAGAFLASPVLLSQVEFFALSARSVVPSGWSFLEMFRGPMSLTGIFPWLLGTFRTLDLSKAFGSSSLGFALFIGASPFLLALFTSARLLMRRSDFQPGDWMSALLVWGYIFILMTPLGNFFYTRLSPLACLGLVVLAASAVTSLPSWLSQKDGAFTIFFVWTLLLLAVLWVGELWAFQHFRGSIQAYFLEKSAAHASSVASTALRSSQIASFPREVGWANPEVMFSWLSLVSLLFALSKTRGPFLRFGSIHLSLGFSLVAVVLFYARFTPCQPIELWERLREGGPAQQGVIQKVAGKNSRIYEDATNFQEQVFPHALASLYGVNVVHGYSALQPSSFFSRQASQHSFPNSWIADWRITKDGSIYPYAPPNAAILSCRLVWVGPQERSAMIIREVPGHLFAEVSPGPAGRLIRTDTYYPGWTAKAGVHDAQIFPWLPFFSAIYLPESRERVELELSYCPPFLKLGIFLALCAVVFLVWFSLKIHKTRLN
jgi:hypothetical protein